VYPIHELLVLLGLGSLGGLLIFGARSFSRRSQLDAAFAEVGSRLGLNILYDPPRIYGVHNGRMISMSLVIGQPTLLIVVVSVGREDLASRWENPPPEMLQPDRLVALILEQLALAEELAIRE
jgi:hypothetical protein